ncbi:hypothetical protein I7I50_04851 [Histoplasma capsulatum G186AR]|uniref:Uncharacterized protein n=1 Tax=Ajellomyces capsulatus TaxID=5037 RepID=A0A8H7ZBS3_AJECA|nr:hypothetical protein I7I52_03109 [Histoplasma capsulatum]QSS75653.1 hypothetical protein I7I50_04851 [Histoplasma capsulatum G186AR]
MPVIRCSSGRDIIHPCFVQYSFNINPVRQAIWSTISPCILPFLYMQRATYNLYAQCTILAERHTSSTSLVTCFGSFQKRPKCLQNPLHQACPELV